MYCTSSEKVNRKNELEMTKVQEPRHSHQNSSSTRYSTVHVPGTTEILHQLQLQALSYTYQYLVPAVCVCVLILKASHYSKRATSFFPFLFLFPIRQSILYLFLFAPKRTGVRQVRRNFAHGMRLIHHTQRC